MIDGAMGGYEPKAFVTHCNGSRRKDGVVTVKSCGCLHYWSTTSVQMASCL